MSFLKNYIEYIKDNPKGLWFKSRLYGWGWVPVKTQGWLVTFFYIISILILALTISETSSNREVIFTFILPVFLLTIIFFRIAYKKGERPRWQWGKRREID